MVVTGMTPTPAGEGKTTTAVGLTQGLGKLGHKAVVTLREPTLGPIFGIKGGGTGGGKATVVPEDEINIHFTGDAHAVASAHNLLAALVDNAVFRQQIPDFEPTGIQWSRVTDASDRALRNVIAGVGGSNNSPLRESRFDIVSASEIMAILALSAGPEDLRQRLSPPGGGNHSRRGCRNRRTIGRSWRADDPAAPHHYAEYGADRRGPAGLYPRRTLRQHRPRVQPQSSATG